MKTKQSTLHWKHNKTMSTNVDLEKKIKELASKIVQDPPGNGRRPDNCKQHYSKNKYNRQRDL